MAVSFDASSESAVVASVGSFNWSHNPVAASEGVLVFVVTEGTTTNYVTAVTYDGEALTAVSGGSSTEADDEPGRVQAYFKGSSINTTDPATVAVTRTNNAFPMWAVAITVQATRNTEIYTPGIVAISGDGALEEESVDDGSPGTNSMRFAVGYRADRLSRTRNLSGSGFKTCWLSRSCHRRLRRCSSGCPRSPSCLWRSIHDLHCRSHSNCQHQEVRVDHRRYNAYSLSHPEWSSLRCCFFRTRGQTVAVDSVYSST
jgi:hypothetical protein